MLPTRALQNLLPRARPAALLRPYVTASAPRLAVGAKSKGAPAAASPARSEAALLDLYAQAIEPRLPPPPPPPSEAQLAEWNHIAKKYVKLMWKRTRVLHRDGNRKARLKWAALHALPTEELRRDALFVDPYVPLELYLPLDTPPLAGFHGPEDAARERARAEAARAAEEDRARERVMAEGVKRASAPKADTVAVGGDFGAQRGTGRSRLRALGSFDFGAGEEGPGKMPSGAPAKKEGGGGKK
jgi:hypothetical protein